LRLRLGDAGLIDSVKEIRAQLAGRENPKTTWLVGSSATPKNLAHCLLDLGAVPFAMDPLLGAMVRTEPRASGPAGVVVKRVRSRAEFACARAIDRAAFKVEREDREEELEREFALQCETSFRCQYLAFIDDEPVGMASSIFTEHGVSLCGGATLDAFRGRGAYRALVEARWVDAVARGTPALVTHAGRMSRPILDRLGFTCVSEVALLMDD
jgi:hypothetical protein